MTLTKVLVRHAIDHTPYEGLRVTGWPDLTIARGRVVMDQGEVTAVAGAARFLPRDLSPMRGRGVLCRADLTPPWWPERRARTGPFGGGHALLPSPPNLRVPREARAAPQLDHCQASRFQVLFRTLIFGM